MIAEVNAIKNIQQVIWHGTDHAEEGLAITSHNFTSEHYLSRVWMRAS